MGDDMNAYGREPDVGAEIRLLPTSADSGRSNPVRSGYRPNHRLLPDYLTSGIHEYLDREEVHPGETVHGRITFISPEAYPGCLWVGKVVDIQEGSRLIGRATITRVLNKLLERDDQ
jgi:elongation factor Tu